MLFLKRALLTIMLVLPCHVTMNALEAEAMGAGYGYGYGPPMMNYGGYRQMLQPFQNMPFYPNGPTSNAIAMQARMGEIYPYGTGNPYADMQLAMMNDSFNWTGAPTIGAGIGAPVGGAAIGNWQRYNAAW
ncbi:MAG: hypothetical protein AB7P04_03205 [Bacteriovoracia bacterium]